MVRRFVPGLVVLLTIGALARVVTAVADLSSVLMVAIILGFLIGNTVVLPAGTEPGIGTDTLWLKTGIVLMGATITLQTVVAAGPRMLLVVVGAVSVTLVTIEALSRWPFDVPAKVGSLLAAGSSICGVSAVAAVSGSIEPDSKQVAYAAATVLVFDVLTIALYPVIGQALGLSDVVYGIWAGTTMFSTGPVTAAGFTYSDTAGEWAVLTKLTRNTLIGLVAVGYAMYYSHRRAGTNGRATTPAYLWETFPKFIIGFILLMMIANLGLFSPDQLRMLTNASDWLFLLAFAGLGLRIDIGTVRETGAAPAAVVGLTLLLVSALTLLTTVYFF